MSWLSHDVSGLPHYVSRLSQAQICSQHALLLYRLLFSTLGLYKLSTQWHYVWVVVIQHCCCESLLHAMLHLSGSPCPFGDLRTATGMGIKMW